mgnify:CR=1 FL=1
MSKAWFVCKARTKDHIDYCKPIVVAVLMNRVAETPALRWIVKTIPETVWQKRELEVAIYFLSRTVLSRTPINTRGERPWDLTRARDNATNELLGAQLLL